jgi:hypothetical protein
MIAVESSPQLPRRTARRLQVRQFLLDCVGFTLVLMAPWVVLLGYHGYAFFTPEVLLITTGVLAIAAILALAVGFGGTLVRTLLLAVLLALFIDVHVTLPGMSSIMVALTFLAAIVVLAGLLWLLREHAAAIVSVIFVTLIAVSALTANPGSQQITSEAGAAAAHASDKPLLIHLVLDEHIGVEGLPPEIPDAQQLRAELIDFYTSRGFRLFGGAYSQYANTFNAIANLLNFAERDVSHRFLRRGTAGREWDLKESAYFRMLQQRGYQLHVYQSTYMELCRANDVRLQSCLTYPVSSLGSIQDLPLRADEKARFMVRALVTRSRVLRVINKGYEQLVRTPLSRRGWDAPQWWSDPPTFGPLPIPAVLKHLTDDIIAHPRGHAFFAHLMVPHYPYVFDEGCVLRPRAADWLTNHIGSADAPIYNTADSRTQKYEQYTDQVRCALNMLDALFAELARRGLLADAIVVINGDHGSRIPEHFPNGLALERGLLTEADYRDTFSTLYAIKAPGVPAAYVEQPAPVVNLLDHYFGGEPLRKQSSCRVFLIAEDVGSGVLTTVEPRFCAREITEESAGHHD